MIKVTHLAKVYMAILLLFFISRQRTFVAKLHNSPLHKNTKQLRKLNPLQTEKLNLLATHPIKLS